jgi:uncharacterized protein
MKISRYNHVATSFFEGKYLAFNALTGSYVELDEDGLSELEALLAAAADDQTLPQSPLQRRLTEGGFVVADEIDELAEVRERYHERRGEARGMSLTIAPTISCNFGCGYCFQSHSKKRMGQDEMAALESFIADKLQPGTSLSITWFGGEPLVAFDVIEVLAPRLQALAASRDCRFSHAIITNGSLLTPEKARVLAAVPVFDYAQITLDGPPELHDKRRFTLAGKPTFSRIVDNLRDVADILPVTIRVNVDRSNAHALGALLDRLIEAGLEGRVNVYLGHVWNYTDEVESSPFLSFEEFATLEAQFKLLKFRKGFGASARVPQPRVGAMCVADHPNGWVVGPTGLLFKCWNEVHEDADRASGVLQGSKAACGGCGDRLEDNAETWARYDPFTHTPCKTCSVAPLCMSGCPWESAKSSPEDTGFCSSYRFNLADELRLFDLQLTVASGPRAREQETATPEAQASASS